MVYQFSDQPTVMPVLITDTRKESWNILGVSVSLSFVNVSVGEPVHTESGTIEQPLEVTVAAKVPTGRHRGLITVFTDNHGARTIQQPPLGICRIAIANQDDIAPRQPDKERQAVHESGTDGCVQTGAAAVTAQAPITVEREGDEFGAPAKIFIGDRATKATVFERHATVR